MVWVEGGDSQNVEFAPLTNRMNLFKLVTQQSEHIAEVNQFTVKRVPMSERATAVRELRRQQQLDGLDDFDEEEEDDVE